MLSNTKRVEVKDKIDMKTVYGIINDVVEYVRLGLPISDSWEKK